MNKQEAEDWLRGIDSRLAKLIYKFHDIKAQCSDVKKYDKLLIEASLYVSKAHEEFLNGVYDNFELYRVQILDRGRTIRGLFSSE